MSVFVRIIQVQTQTGPRQFAAHGFHTVEDSDRFGATIHESGTGIDQGVAELVDAPDLLNDLLAGSEDVYDLNAA